MGRAEGREKGETIAVVGARSVSAKYGERIVHVVDDLLGRGFTIASGGAMGADQYVLSRLIARGRFNRGVVFSAWDTMRAFPVKVRRDIAMFQHNGGQIVWGTSSGAGHRGAIKGALLYRNRKMVDASDGVVAFLTEQSRGTFFTVQTAIESRRKLAVFPIDRTLPNFKAVKWVPMACGGVWDGAYRAVYLR